MKFSNIVRYPNGGLKELSQSNYKDYQADKTHYLSTKKLGYSGLKCRRRSEGAKSTLPFSYIDLKQKFNNMFQKVSETNRNSSNLSNNKGKNSRSKMFDEIQQKLKGKRRLSVISLEPSTNIQGDKKSESKKGRRDVTKVKFRGSSSVQDKSEALGNKHQSSGGFVYKSAKKVPFFTPRNLSQDRISVVDINKLPEIKLPQKSTRTCQHSLIEVEDEPAAGMPKEKQTRLHLILLKFKEDLKENSETEFPPELQLMMHDPLIQKFIEIEIINPPEKSQTIPEKTRFSRTIPVKLTRQTISDVHEQESTEILTQNTSNLRFPYKTRTHPHSKPNSNPKILHKATLNPKPHQNNIHKKSAKPLPKPSSNPSQNQPNCLKDHCQDMLGLSGGNIAACHKAQAGTDVRQEIIVSKSEDLKCEKSAKAIFPKSLMFQVSLSQGEIENKSKDEKKELVKKNLSGKGDIEKHHPLPSSPPHKPNPSRPKEPQPKLAERKITELTKHEEPKAANDKKDLGPGDVKKEQNLDKNLLSPNADLNFNKNFSSHSSLSSLAEATEFRSAASTSNLREIPNGKDRRFNSPRRIKKPTLKSVRKEDPKQRSDKPSESKRPKELDLERIDYKNIDPLSPNLSVTIVTPKTSKNKPMKTLSSFTKKSKGKRSRKTTTPSLKRIEKEMESIKEARESSPDRTEALKEIKFELTQGEPTPKKRKISLENLEVKLIEPKPKCKSMIDHASENSKQSELSGNRTEVDKVCPAFGQKDKTRRLSNTKALALEKLVKNFNKTTKSKDYDSIIDARKKQRLSHIKKKIEPQKDNNIESIMDTFKLKEDERLRKMTWNQQKKVLDIIYKRFMVRDNSLKHMEMYLRICYIIEKVGFANLQKCENLLLDVDNKYDQIVLWINKVERIYFLEGFLKEQ
ncbi:unnamed protein product [Moneuplotes crassus]|uniref:Uncharacterized protein n=1 Tax=Euplotes crassus TaxID=5936 RepID=A0AAD1Y4F3_EUPCR|nr:unnamed protein product [Moneuplotes crassus]